jgi:hypothetical protein
MSTTDDKMLLCFKENKSSCVTFGRKRSILFGSVIEKGHQCPCVNYVNKSL